MKLGKQRREKKKTPKNKTKQKLRNSPRTKRKKGLKKMMREVPRIETGNIIYRK